MKYARIVNGIVIELYTPPAGLTIQRCFHASVAAQFVEIPEGINPEQNWTYDGVKWAPPSWLVTNKATSE